MKIIFLMLIVFGIFLGITLAATETTLRARINPTGLEFFSGSGHHLIDEEIPKIEIPTIEIPITGGPGKGWVKVERLKINKFRTPSFDFQLSSNGISWQSRKGSAKLAGDWSAEYTLILPVEASGWVEIVVADIHMNVTAIATALDGRPQVEVQSCEADITHVDVSLGGSFLPWFVNLFRGPLSIVLKKEIHAQACRTARTLLLDEANAFLHSLPLHFAIGNDFFVNYYLLESPLFTNSYIQADLKADVVYSEKKCALPATQLGDDAGTHLGMITFWLSSQVPNCLLNSAHDGGLIQILINKDTSSVGNYLKTSCSFLSICMGKFFKKLRNDYPNQYIDLHFHSLTPPELTFKKDLATLNVTLAVDFYINPKGIKTKPLARLELITTSSIVPYIEGNRLVGTLNGTTAEAKEIFSTIGDVSSTFLSVFQKLFIVSDEILVNILLKKGVPLPIYDNVTIANSTVLNVFDGFVRVNVDFTTVS
ncbi:unnamed protein product, partial [Mesorhabditis belari]|uniref:Uncharacterized protein n=1 Tax=Mesorhabditis belari TaxID=2138241 RepID=A0AAF3E8A5_9BILA